MSKQAIYFPGLNGLRAISAIAVVFSHITTDLNEFNLNPNLFGKLPDGSPKGYALANYGVTIFFVLSGFLITYLLQAEKEIQTIDVKKFYWRRILRIWPLYYLYILIALVVILSFNIDLNLQSLFLTVFYAANVPFIFGAGVAFIDHYWTLGVEEQFYIFWPWFNKITGSLIKPIFFLIIGIVGLKLTLHVLYPNSIIETIINVNRFHCMMIGALGAILYKQQHSLFLKLVDNIWTQAICWLIMLLIAINKYHLASVIDNEFISLVAVLIIIGQIQLKHRIVNLELAPLNFLGKISYGIYLIHPLIIFLYAKLLAGLSMGSTSKYLLVYFLILTSTILLAHFSYHYFESFFLKYKKKFEVVKSSASNNPT